MASTLKYYVVMMAQFIQDFCCRQNAGRRRGTRCRGVVDAKVTNDGWLRVDCTHIACYMRRTVD